MRIPARLLLWRDDLIAGDGPDRVSTLDGLRGLAVLMVLASHTQFLGMYGQGGYGVWLFFALSGYLLSQPFLNIPQLTAQRYGRFLWRRFLRIVPAYWVVVLLIHYPIMGYGLPDAISNATLWDTSIHFWSVKQELLLYFTLPLLLSIVQFFGGHYLAYASVVMILATLSHLMLGPDWVTVDDGVRLFIFPFLVGIAVAAVERSSAFSRFKTSRWAHFFSSVGVVGFLVSIFATAPWIYDSFLAPVLGERAEKSSWAWTHYWALSLGCGAVLLCVLPNGWLARVIFGNAVIRSIGILGYSIYLVHMAMLKLASLLGIPSGTPAFVATLSLSFLTAVFLYGYVERLFWKPSTRGAASRVDSAIGGYPLRGY